MLDFSKHKTEIDEGFSPYRRYCERSIAVEYNTLPSNTEMKSSYELCEMEEYPNMGIVHKERLNAYRHFLYLTGRKAGKGLVLNKRSTVSEELDSRKIEIVDEDKYQKYLNQFLPQKSLKQINKEIYQEYCERHRIK